MRWKLILSEYSKKRLRKLRKKDKKIWEQIRKKLYEIENKLSNHHPERILQKPLRKKLHPFFQVTNWRLATPVYDFPEEKKYLYTQKLL